MSVAGQQREIIWIDMETWDRREQYEFMINRYLPYFSLTTTIDVTNALRFARAHDISFYYTMIHCCMKAAGGVENFRYRIRPAGVALLPALRAGFTFLPPGTDLFRQTAIDMEHDLFSFARRAAETALRQESFDGIDGDDVIYFTINPWVKFTSLHRSVSDLRTDSVPKIAFGRYETVGGITEMPIDILVNHTLADGLHVSRFFQGLHSELAALPQ